MLSPTYACGVNETAATERLDGRTVLLLLVTVVALTIVDAVLGRTLFETMVPALVADAAVALAVLHRQAPSARRDAARRRGERRGVRRRGRRLAEPVGAP